jgi:hypothetical protein
MMLAMLGGVNPKSVNTMQDLSSYLFNPQYGITGNTYESAYTLPEPYVPNTPRLDAYMNSSNAIWRDVASGIQSGSLDEASAVAALYNGLGFEYDTQVKQGLSVSDLRSAVKEMFDEKERDMSARIEYDRNLLEAERENVFGKAGLPQPYDEWSAETMPVSDDLKAFLSRLSTIQKDVDTAKDDVIAAEKLAKSRMLGAVRPSKIVNPEKEYRRLVDVDIDIGKDIEGRTNIDKIIDSRTNVDKRLDSGYGTKRTNISDEEANEQKLFLNRAINQSAQDARRDAINLQRKLAYNQAVGANRLLGEQIALGIQGRTPLEEALRRRALGLQGM